MNQEVLKAARTAFNSENPPIFGVAVEGDRVFVLATIHEKFHPNRKERYSGWKYSGIFEIKPQKHGCALELHNEMSFRFYADALDAFEQFVVGKPHATNPAEIDAILPPEKKAKVLRFKKE